MDKFKSWYKGYFMLSVMTPAVSLSAAICTWVLLNESFTTTVLSVVVALCVIVAEDKYLLK